MFTRRRTLASLIAALVVAVIAQDASGLAFFIGNGFKEAIIWQAGAFFIAASSVLFVLTFIAGMLGLLAKRWTALIVGVVASLTSAILGMFLQIILQGGAFTIEVIQSVYSSILGVNLIFIISGAVATLTAGVASWRAIVGKTREAKESRIAFVRAPATSLSDGLVTHIERSAIDLDLADQQWDNYVAALNAAGWRTIEVDQRNDLADSVFVEDSVVMLGNLAVLTSPGAASREAEIEGTERAVRDLGLQVERISKPGTLDGGDVLKVGKTIYVGRGGRTNGEGIRQLRSIAATRGYNVVAVPVTKALHLKTAVTALPDGTVIGYPPLVDDPGLFERFLPVPEAEGTAVVVLAADSVLMSSTAPKSAELFRELGYRVTTVDISEFEKLEGCVTCLSVRVRQR